jgi:UDP-N-acetylglucosamine transferase subunit ALG13
MLLKREPAMQQPYLFVTVGSTDFDPLVQKVDEVVPRLGLNAGIMQIGNGRHLPVNMPYFRFAPTLDPYYAEASLVVAHGGLAITMEVLIRGLPLVSVSNADRYDQHQEDLLRALANEGFLLWCQRLDDLAESIDRAQSTSLRRYTPPASNIHSVIDHYLSALTK